MRCAPPADIEAACPKPSHRKTKKRRSSSRRQRSGTETNEPGRRRIPLLAVFAGLVTLFTVFVGMQSYVLLQHPQAAIAEAASRAAAAASSAPAERRPPDRQRAVLAAHAVADTQAAEREEEGEEGETTATEPAAPLVGSAVASKSPSTAAMPAAAAAAATSAATAAAADPAVTAPVGASQSAASVPAASESADPAALGPVLTEGAQCSEEPAALPLDVTLVMHASAERLWMIAEICARWGGPMVAVFGGPDADGVMRSAWPPPEEATLRNRSLGGGGVGCALRRLRPTVRAQDHGKAYPINWLRNRGIACVRTTHYFMVDVDFWPSRSLRTLVRAQLPGWRDAPRALVVPNFQRNGHGCRNDESNPHACREALAAGRLAMPDTFEALQACIGDKDCAVFDSEWNAAGQSSTNVGLWKQMGENQTRRLKCLQSARYEPFTVVRRGLATPLFDERFYGYGKNKVSFLVELRLAGFEFVVLGRGFLLHFPHPKSAAKDRWLHTSAHQKVERIYQAFEDDVAAKYKNTTQRTPLCQPRIGHP